MPEPVRNGPLNLNVRIGPEKQQAARRHPTDLRHSPSSIKIAVTRVRTTKAPRGVGGFFTRCTEIVDPSNKERAMAKVRMCEVCKQPIDPERLEGSPETRLCTTHAAEIQKYGGEFLMSAVQERTSKAGSLKLNYGGITTTRTRNDEAMRRLKDEHAKP
jgi:hypothetical protein